MHVIHRGKIYELFQLKRGQIQLAVSSAILSHSQELILIIFLIILVGSVSCERSFSALRRLKLWTRSSMTEERLSGLATS